MSRPLHFLAALLACLASTLALADPPARVGRIAHLENGVEFRVDRDAPGEAATLNWPVSSGAALATDRDGRAEIWIGSTAYRIGGGSQLEFVAVDDDRVAVRVDAGTLALSILDAEQAADIALQTPDGRIRFAASGRYRVDVRNGATTLSVQAGAAELDDGRRRTRIEAGEQARLDDGLSIGRDDRSDGFDRWVAERENATLAGPARRHVSPYMTGYQDLDAWGDWQASPDYGTLWYPRAVPADWAPYRFGRWAWIAPWGWTWIDQAPWGFAPFHYGRWVIVHGRWAWVPGRLVARPVYAPALVAWIGNPGWSLSFSFGSAPAVGWFPLGPREVYVPGYRHGPTYVRRINVTHIHDPLLIDRATRPDARHHYAYREMPRAVTVVPADHLRQGRPIGAREFKAPRTEELRTAPLRTAPGDDWLRAHRSTEQRPLRRADDGPRGAFRSGEGATRPDMRPETRPETRPEARPEMRPAVRPFDDRRDPEASPAIRRPAVPERADFPDRRRPPEADAADRRNERRDVERITPPAAVRMGGEEQRRQPAENAPLFRPRFDEAPRNTPEMPRETRRPERPAVIERNDAPPEMRRSAPRQFEAPVERQRAAPEMRPTPMRERPQPEARESRRNERDNERSGR